MAKPAVNLARLFKPFENKWVALSLDHKKILGSGNTLNQAKKAADKTKKAYLFHKVLPFDLRLAPGAQ